MKKICKGQKYISVQFPIDLLWTAFFFF